MFGKNNERRRYLFYTLCAVKFILNFSESHATFNNEPLDNNEASKRHIYSCFRHSSSSSKEEGKEKLRHCFIELRDMNNNSLDTRGYFVEGAMQECAPNHPTVQCNLERENATNEDWIQITRFYDKHGPQHYDVLNNNCCTLAVNALASIGIKNTPLYNVNLGIGTKIKPNEFKEKLYVSSQNMRSKP